MNDPKSVDPRQVFVGSDQRPVSGRYFFDVDDGDAFHRDDTGIDLASTDHIASEAYNILKQIVHDKWPEGQRTMTARVRDESGKVIYEGTMMLNGRRFPL